MVKRTLINSIEGNIEICCSEMTKTPTKNLQIPFALVHLTFSDQYLVISIFKISSVKWEKIGGADYWSTFENTKFLSLEKFKNWEIWESSLGRHSNICFPIFL